MNVIEIIPLNELVIGETYDVVCLHGDFTGVYLGKTEYTEAYVFKSVGRSLKRVKTEGSIVAVTKTRTI